MADRGKLGIHVMKSSARRRNIRNIGFGESWIRGRRVRDVEKGKRL